MFARLVASACGSLVLLAYISLIALLPAMYWVMDGGLTLGLWLAFAAFVCLSGWWVIWREAPKFGWVWLGAFAVLHLMLYYHPAIWHPWAEDRCLDAGRRWHNGECSQY